MVVRAVARNACPPPPRAKVAGLVAAEAAWQPVLTEPRVFWRPVWKMAKPSPPSKHRRNGEVTATVVGRLTAVVERAGAV